LCLEPGLGADLFSLCQVILLGLRDLVGFFLAHGRVAHGSEYLTGESITQAAVFQMLLVDAAVVERADIEPEHRCPERFALCLHTAVALVKVFAASAVGTAGCRQDSCCFCHFSLTSCVSLPFKGGRIY